VLRRKILKESEIDGRPVWIDINEDEIRTGDRIKIRLEIEASQAIDYVQLRDYRPSSMEPDQSLSGFRWGGGVSWYQTFTDQYFDFYISHLPKGFSFFEYDLYTEQSGSFSKGYAEIQSHYAPEYMARSEGGRINIKID
jgi:uncharacterized protein YfaS (alpha-2-macroglobulin family)